MVKNSCSHSAHKHKIHFHMHNSNKYTQKNKKKTLLKQQSSKQQGIRESYQENLWLKATKRY